MKETGLIPTKDICVGSNLRGIKLSPNGVYVSYITKNVNGEQIILKNLDRGIEIKTKKFFQNIVAYGWILSGEYFIVINDKLGKAEVELVRYNMFSFEYDKTFTNKQMQIKILNSCVEYKNQVVIGVNQRDPRYFDIYILDVDKWHMYMIFENNQYYRILIDNDFKARLGCKMDTKGGYVVECIDTKKILFKVEADDFFGTFPLFITKDNTLIIKDCRFSDKSVIKEISLGEINSEKIIAFSEKVDVEKTVMDVATKKLEAVSFYYKKREWMVLDKNYTRDFEFLMRFCEGDLDICSKTLDANQWIVQYNKSNYPTQYFLYYRKSKKIKKIFVAHGEEYASLFAVKEPIIITKDNDNIELINYIIKPLNKKNKYPLVINLHGGPWQRDLCQFTYLHQWLINRGYIVLSINYRGSMGFGKMFLNSSNCVWDRILDEDIAYSVEKIYELYNIDKENIGVIGNSFGGYLAQLAITRRNDLFKCAISIGGISDLHTGLSAYPVFKSFQKHILEKSLGVSEFEMLSQSPIKNIDGNCGELFLIHGKNDPVVDFQESINMHQKFIQMGLVSQCLIFEDEGHAIKKLKNKIIMYHQIEKFLQRNLGGNAEED